MNDQTKVDVGEAPSEVTIELADGTILRRVPTDASGQPIGHYDERIAHANMGGMPQVTRIPPIRVLEMYADAATGEVVRLLVAYRKGVVFPGRAEVEVEEHGSMRIVDVIPQPSLRHRDKRADEALFEVLVKPA